ncbi:MAG: hypothetical protein QM811_20125 [Pirellulales bacterium]
MSTKSSDIDSAIALPSENSLGDSACDVIAQAPIPVRTPHVSSSSSKAFRRAAAVWASLAAVACVLLIVFANRRELGPSDEIATFHGTTAKPTSPPPLNEGAKTAAAPALGIDSMGEQAKPNEPGKPAAAANYATDAQARKSSDMSSTPSDGARPWRSTTGGILAFRFT